MNLKQIWCAVMAFGLLAPPMASAQSVPPVPPVPPSRMVMPAIPPMPVMPMLPLIPDIDAMMMRAEAVIGRLDFSWRDDDQRSRADEDRQRADEQKQRDAERKQRVDESYQRGQEMLERSQWARAVDQFSQVVDSKTSARIDAALYWKAYALDKLAQQADALATLGELMKGFPNSRWLADAKALEMQVRQNSGQKPSPEAESDEDLKLLAIQGLQHSDPEQAVPMLEKFLAGNQSPRLKERALFVLAQSNSPRARQVLMQMAKGGSNPDVQRKAIQYLGVNGTPENRQALSDIYAASTDVDIKRQILQAFFISGDVARLIEAANTETNVDLRGVAVRQLGTMSPAKTGDALLTIYAKEKDPNIKRQVINGLFIQNNAEALVALARKESDVQSKKDIVSKLSLMKSKVALDYLMEILNK